LAMATRDWCKASLWRIVRLFTKRQKHN